MNPSAEDLPRYTYQLRKKSLQLSRWRLHLNFNKLCETADFIPPSLRIRDPVRNPFSSVVIRRAQLHLLSSRIKGCHSNIRFISKSVKGLIFLVSQLLTNPEMADLLQSITRDIRLQKNDITQRHNSKLHHWIKKYNFPAYLLETYLPQSPQGVVNLSDYVLPSADAEILSLGLKYRLPGPSDIPRIIAGVEPALRGLNHQDTHRIRHFVTSTLQRPYNIPKPSLAMNRVISRLKRNRDIVITKSDKGSQTVILNTTVYKQKMQNVLDQHSIFSAITEQEHKTSVKNFRLLLLRLKRSQQITKEQYNDFTANLAQIAYIYGLPKIHKPDVPLRPIISYHLSPAYTLSKFLSNFLTPLLQSPPWEYTIANSPSFVSYITSLTPPPGMSTFTFDTQFFKQTKGSPMGSPLSTVVAEVVMRSLDQWITSRHSSDIFLWRRYIDDTFCLVSEVSASHILSDLNSFHPDIAFTHETENHSVLPFLDTLVIRTPSSFHTTVYYKNNTPPHHTNFRSHCPTPHKINTVRALTKRIFTHCSLPLFQTIEKAKIFSYLSKSGYPTPFILKHMHDPHHNSAPAIHRNICSLPFCPQSITIARFLRQHGIATYFQNPPNIATLIRHPITRSSLHASSLRSCGAVYSVSCDQCNATYVGETGRSVAIRMVEAFFQQLPNHWVPLTGSPGALRREEQLALQNPTWDTDPELCRHLPSFLVPALRSFAQARDSMAADIGIAVPSLAAPAECRRCGGQLSAGEVSVVCPRLGAFHPACFTCSRCGEWLADLRLCVADSQPYCGRHYAELFLPRCALCHEVSLHTPGLPLSRCIPQCEVLPTP
ncbi:hypothetical protein LAZ67_13002214 [Cordylochernes scorpioides]|uniref:Reverse transcriptase domain-containing protein n=1 Tax=Cordylochernes scorpioides TaxID=51811 RepID=A0ABY6L4G1_9ARAC|nr:hypothetical protein LAZ67_13002214 [Cordylochernes scorpioides]